MLIFYLSFYLSLSVSVCLSVCLFITGILCLTHTGTRTAHTSHTYCNDISVQNKDASKHKHTHTHECACTDAVVTGRGVIRVGSLQEGHCSEELPRALFTNKHTHTHPLGSCRHRLLSSVLVNSTIIPLPSFPSSLLPSFSPFFSPFLSPYLSQPISCLSPSLPKKALPVFHGSLHTLPMTHHHQHQHTHTHARTRAQSHVDS